MHTHPNLERKERLHLCRYFISFHLLFLIDLIKSYSSFLLNLKYGDTWVLNCQERKMVDSSRVWAKGGDGGNGCWSVHRSRTDWRGKPDGICLIYKNADHLSIIYDKNFIK